MQPLSEATLAELDTKNMAKESPILIRVFKEESELEVWKVDKSGRFALLHTYPICRWSGELGPKIDEGDLTTCGTKPKVIAAWPKRRRTHCSSRSILSWQRLAKKSPARSRTVCRRDKQATYAFDPLGFFRPLPDPPLTLSGLSRHLGLLLYSECRADPPCSQLRKPVIFPAIMANGHR